LLDRHRRVQHDQLVEVDERPSEPACALLAHRRLARAHQPDEHEMAARVAVGRGHRSEARYASWLRTNSVSESPPNFRNASDASTSDTIVSATTPAAGTAVTSVRSLNDTDS